MSSFCNLTTAYSGDEMDKLDKMARILNNKRKEQIKTTSGDFDRQQNQIKNTVEQMKNNHGFNFFKEQELHNDKDEQLMGINEHTEHTEDAIKSVGLNSLISDDSEYSTISSLSSDLDGSNISIGSNRSNVSNISNRSISTSSNASDCISTDNISLDSISSDNKMLNHISNCKKCRIKILKLVKNRKKKKKHQHINTDMDMDIDDKEILPSSGKNQKKEFVIMYFVSILIVFIIDLIIRFVKV